MTSHDVVVVGGGPAGCSAALFTARYGLDVTIFDRGPSSIHQCAFIENYLGFPGGIDVETFDAMSQAQAERVGATVVDDLVEDVTASDGRRGFRVETQHGEAVTAGRVVAATTYDVSYLESLLGEHFLSDGGEEYLDPGLAGDRGETPVDGLWLAGPTAGVASQIAVAVGHGARVGLDVVTDYRREAEGWWDDAADHTDWVVERGRYEGEEWLETIADHYAESAPEELDPDQVRQRTRALAVEQQSWQIDAAEIQRRRERAHHEILDHVDDEAILEHFDSETILDHVDDEAILEQVDDEAILEQVDDEAILEHVDGEVIREHPRETAVEDTGRTKDINKESKSRTF